MATSFPNSTGDLGRVEVGYSTAMNWVFQKVNVTWARVRVREIMIQVEIKNKRYVNFVAVVLQ